MVTVFFPFHISWLHAQTGRCHVHYSLFSYPTMSQRWLVDTHLSYFSKNFFLVLWPNSGHDLLIHEVSRSHTSHHSRQDSCGRVISSSQRPLPDNTHRPRGHSERHFSEILRIKSEPYGNNLKFILRFSQMITFPSKFMTKLW